MEFLQFNTLSDHSPTIISLTPHITYKSKSFKFLNMWLLHPKLSSLVREYWDSPVAKTKQYTFCMKLKSLKPPLRILNRLDFSHISERVKRAKLSFAEAQTQLLNNPSSAALKCKVKECRKHANFKLEAERMFFQKKLKNKHLMLAGRGTQYFHSLLKKRNSSSSIASLIKADGSPTTSQEEVITELIGFYEDMLGTESTTSPISQAVIDQRPVLTSEDCALLSSPIDNASIKEALFQIRDDKAPGPDGFTAAFFKSNWDIIQSDFLAVVQEFFETGKLLKQFNHVVIPLIPKTKHAPAACDFRPISCCNVFYKTVTKIIANRLAATIPNIIDPAQGAFLADRLMIDNVLLAQQMVRRYGRKSSSLRSMMMVDIKKAFDTLSWDFLINWLKRLGFPCIMISWIRECITTATCSISLNGNLHGSINDKRGLRKGDPISPFLFILAMEYLSRCIKANTQDPDFNFHPKCEKIGLTHLGFADDIILFSRGDVKSVGILFYSLQQFSLTFGLHLNLSKSKLFGVRFLDFDIQSMH